MKEILTSQEAKVLISQGAQIIDVRTHSEYQQDAVKGAINMPLEKLRSSPPNLDASKPVLVYCRTGGRSAKAAELLLNQGFKSVYNAGSLTNLI